MATPYTKIQNVFYSCPQVKTEIWPDLERQFFFNALGDFSLDLYDLDYDEETDEVIQDLSQSEVNVIGKLMYKHYLLRERDRVIKLNNIVGRDISLTGTGDTKRFISAAYESLLFEIDSMMHKLKTNTFYDE